MEEIRRAFALYFEEPSLALPENPPARGELRGGGWTVRYVVEGADQPTLELYATHRMTSDRHARIRGSGEVEELETLQSELYLSDDSEESWARAAQAQDEHNRHLVEYLRKKGLLPG